MRTILGSSSTTRIVLMTEVRPAPARGSARDGEARGVPPRPGRFSHSAGAALGFVGPALPFFKPVRHPFLPMSAPPVPAPEHSPHEREYEEDEKDREQQAEEPEAERPVEWIAVG